MMKNLLQCFFIRKVKLLFVLTGTLLVITCGSGKSKFREYTETTTGGGRFGNTGINNPSDPVSAEEIDLFNQITSEQPLSDGVEWKTPTGWKEIDGTGVRLVSFRTRNDLEVTLIAFPGSVGGVRANLSRWLGQIEVKLNDDEINNFIKTLQVSKTGGGSSQSQVGSLSYILVDFEGYSPIAKQNHLDTIIAAIFGFSDQMLFVKLFGDKKSVATDKNDFLNFVKTIQVKSS